MTSHHQCVCCIIPNHMLEQIILNGNDQQKEKAIRSLSHSEQARGYRQAPNLLAPLGITPEGDKGRTVYDAGEGTVLPGRLVRAEGDSATSDPAVNEAYDGAGAAYDLFQQEYGRNSIDDQGMRLDSTVHFSKGYDNAMWYGQQMIYGDGDEDLPEGIRLWNRFTVAIDIIGHELTHGVTQFEAGLVYRSDPGALNESFSDVFGSMVKQRFNGQTADQADWLIGAGLFTSNVNGSAIRSMKDPGTAYDDPVLGKDRQPGHMNDYQKLPPSYDDGGVHINSGIPNHAFYFAATEIGGFAWEKAGLIWYITLRDRLRKNSGFKDAADATFQVAGELFGAGSREQEAVRNGWALVGIDINGGGGKGKKK